LWFAKKVGKGKQAMATTVTGNLKINGLEKAG